MNGLSKLILSAIAAVTLLAYFTSYYGWQIYLELLAHFQVQYLVLTLILLGGLIFLRNKKHVYWGIFFCAFLSIQTLVWYLPFNALFTSAPASDLRILTANINTQNKSYEKVLELVRAEKPDVAVFIEVDRQWQSQLDALKDLLPYSSGESNPYNLGLLIYSNKLLEQPEINFFGTEKNPSIITQLTVGDRSVTLLATHPFPPVKPSFFQSRNRQFELIANYLAGVNNRIIMVGDLNVTMWSPYYRRLVGKTNLSNTRKGFGILPSWATPGTYEQIPDWLTSMMAIPIDHCLISKGLHTTGIHLGRETGSDHLPVIIDLQVTPFN